jgi:PleD family two-component response regulator
MQRAPHAEICRRHLENHARLLCFGLDTAGVIRNVNPCIRCRELSSAHQNILELKRTDPLAGLANRRHFDNRSGKLVSLSRRRAQPLSWIMTDIDTCKRGSHTHGHLVGDRVLVVGDRLLAADDGPSDAGACEETEKP